MLIRGVWNWCDTLIMGPVPHLHITTRVFWALQDDFEVIESDSCGTHVHVSIAQRPGWDGALHALKRVAKAILYFERSIDSLMPAHRLRNKFCRSNRYNAGLRSRNMSSIFASIDKIPHQSQSPHDTSGYNKLVELMCPDDGSTTTRYYRWNFTPLLREKQNPDTRTIEFRQPPGCTSEVDAKSWLLFTVAFVFGAMQFFDDSRVIDLNHRATLDRLQRLVTLGINKYPNFLWIGTPSELDGHIFQGRTQLSEGQYPESLPTAEDLALRHKKRKVEEEKFDKTEAYARELRVLM